MPMQRDQYPDNWEAIALAVKQQADWRCEKCGRQCRRPGEMFDTHRRTLTTAHIDHHPANCEPENLIALCPACHLAYDAPMKAMRRLKRLLLVEYERIRRLTNG